MAKADEHAEEARHEAVKVAASSKEDGEGMLTDNPELEIDEYRRAVRERIDRLLEESRNAVFYNDLVREVRDAE